MPQLRRVKEYFKKSKQTSKHEIFHFLKIIFIFEFEIYSESEEIRRNFFNISSHAQSDSMITS